MTDSNPSPDEASSGLLQDHVAALYAHLNSPADSLKQKLLNSASQYISPEALGMLFDAGFESVESIKSLHLHDPDSMHTPEEEEICRQKMNADLNAVEAFLKKQFKPGHRKQIIQVFTLQRD